MVLFNTAQFKHNIVKNFSAGFKITYFGYISTGNTGDLKKIDKAIRHITSPFSCSRNLDNKWQKLNLPVYFEVCEMGVKVISSQTSEVGITNTNQRHISNYIFFFKS